MTRAFIVEGRVSTVELSQNTLQTETHQEDQLSTISVLGKTYGGEGKKVSGQEWTCVTTGNRQENHRLDVPAWFSPLGWLEGWIDKMEE